LDKTIGDFPAVGVLPKPPFKFKMPFTIEIVGSKRLAHRGLRFNRLAIGSMNTKTGETHIFLPDYQSLFGVYFFADFQTLSKWS
jgi:hypothetical protein